ncbi:chitooligosaccharidolytic beta-N-acetylglucosaminidase-like [Daphnia pulex]|uniref:chitooligosaccharidolytic beta-N-acetylglucosaminidase-like n=1 Tax=Daphnia pulex TaxID=6669 RepID=UPI001EDEA2FF|nr:chitooligosaccharidolytic beta-N-acetylglucosaminidase-like [Daphnia pulex]XP_046459258.1 chitooligosaccharidolytic beta-N-acetylglucosaminidase-like [Daphnia pulex]
MDTKFLFFIGLFSIAQMAVGQSRTGEASPWAWACRTGRGCVKVEKDSPVEEGDNMNNPTLAGCKLTCNDESVLWPKPRDAIYLSKTLVSFLPVDIRINRINAPSSEVKSLTNEAIAIFRGVLRKSIPEAFRRRNQTAKDGQRPQIHIEVSITSGDVRLGMETQESYNLHVKTIFATAATPASPRSITSVSITATTFFGARHAIETLSQIMAWDKTLESMIMLTDANISDSPAFVHRGLIIDTSRNFVSVPVIKKIIDAMSYDKLNVFHWHLTDSQSFPFVSTREPRLALYGAYSSDQVYHPEDIKELVHYATVRGVKIVPEFDAPGHVGSGWEWGERAGMGQLALCLNIEPWHDYCAEPPCGILNPINDNIYSVLSNIYQDMNDLFQSDIFHMGGDGVKFKCWNETTEIIDWLRARGRNDYSKEDFLYLWSHFQNRSLEEVDKAYGNKQPIVLWTSPLTDDGNAEKFLDKERYIIQIWAKGTDQSIAQLYRQGFKLIMTNYDAWYFDCGYGQWVGKGPNNWCSPYSGWQKVYENSPRKLITNFNETFNSHQILGGEAAIWTEQVDGAAIEGKLWPRSSALAERLWTDPDTNWRTAEHRMNHHRERLVQRGIQADGLQPEWCHQNEGYCFL